MRKLRTALRIGAGVLLAAVMIGSASGMDQPPANDEHDLRDHCDRPAPPPAIDGATVTKEQLDAAHDAVSDFLKASNHYQLCIRYYIGGREDMARMTKGNLPPWMYQLAQEKIDANQKDKAAVGEAYNAAVKAYHDKHP